MIWSLTKNRHYGMIWDYQSALRRASEALRRNGAIAEADEVERCVDASQTAIACLEQNLKATPQEKIKVQRDLLFLTNDNYFNRADLGHALGQKDKTKQALYAVCERYIAKC